LPNTLALEERKEMTEEVLKHGSYACYTNQKCRCELCKMAAREYMQKYRRTDMGRDKSRKYTQTASKRAAMAAKWVKKNEPAVWVEICASVSVGTPGSV
jgi:hypothetical protein